MKILQGNFRRSRLLGAHPGTTTKNTRSPRQWNAGFIRQAGELRVGLPDESGVPVTVSGCARRLVD
jgi:hypothetical protein